MTSLAAAIQIEQIIQDIYQACDEYKRFREQQYERIEELSGHQIGELFQDPTTGFFYRLERVSVVDLSCAPIGKRPRKLFPSFHLYRVFKNDPMRMPEMADYWTIPHHFIKVEDQGTIAKLSVRPLLVLKP